MATQAQAIQNKCDRFMTQLDQELSKYPALNRLDRQLPFPKAYLVVGLLSLFTFLIFFNMCVFCSDRSGAGFLTNVIGFFIPAYFSMAALESPQPQDDIQWLTYWVVFGFFNFLESFVSVVLYWFPFYYTFKTLAIMWLVAPQTQGAKLVYYKVLRPAFQSVSGGVKNASAPTTVPDVKSSFSASSTASNLHAQ